MPNDVSHGRHASRIVSLTESSRILRDDQQPRPCKLTRAVVRHQVVHRATTILLELDPMTSQPLVNPLTGHGAVSREQMLKTNSKPSTNTIAMPLLTRVLPLFLNLSSSHRCPYLPLPLPRYSRSRL